MALMGAQSQGEGAVPGGMTEQGSTLCASVRYGFAIGDFGLNLYWQGLGLFLIYFQTDVLGIPPAWAGICYLVASVWDGMTDPLIGAVADRTRTRWGKYRPFLLFGSVPLAIGFALSFSAPDLPQAWLIAYSLATQLLVRAAYTTLAIPYSSLSAAITNDSEARTGLTGLRMQCAFLGGIAVAYLMPALSAWFGSGHAKAAYGYAAAVIGALATAAFLLCFASVREPGAQGPAECDRPVLPPLLADAREFLRVALRSGPVVRLLLGKILIVFALTMHTRNAVYYLKYVLGAVDAVSYAMPLLTAASFFSVPLWVRIIGRVGKRTAWRAGAVATAMFCGAIQAGTSPSLPFAIFLLCGVAASSTAFAVCFWAMLPDTIEYNEFQFGRRDEAKLFGVASFTQKIAMGLSAASAGMFLDDSGFVANAALRPEAVEAVRTTMGLVPAVGAVLSFLVMRGYGLDSEEHGRIVRELAARNARRASQ
jgi:GPH family glycoside/pentoside/hexuronide:cation symporter